MAAKKNVNEIQAVEAESGSFTAGEDTEKAVKAAVQQTASPVYSVDELARAADKVFGKGTSPYVVRAALRMKGVESATVDDAKKLVEAFAHKEVKA